MSKKTVPDRSIVEEDIWIPNQCGRCYGGCGISVHRVNGVAVQINGVPESTQGSQGGLCSKGLSGLQLLYDPNRLNKPLKRTNPEKGLYVDPKWKEISWEEAISEVVQKLNNAAAKDPKRIFLQGTTCRALKNTTDVMFPIMVGLGSPKGKPEHWPGGGGLHCGQGAHENTGMVYASWSHVPDFKYCNYAIYFGASKGHGSGHAAMITARMAAEAKSRGMKLVVFDPMANQAGGKATEWVPILPGTDAAVILAICNIIVNDIGKFDEKYIKLKTNGPYLIGPDGRYVREKDEKRKEPLKKRGHFDLVEEEVVGDDDNNKPLVWDEIEGKAKVYDDPTIKEYALLGEYEVHGKKCYPAWHLIKDNVKKYTAEYASEVSTVPAKTIIRIAHEFLEAAQIGSTIRLDSHDLPLRPAAAVMFRGGEGHENSHHSCLATSFLNAIVGNCEVPGGTLGWPARCLGFPGTGELKFEPTKGIDGMIQTDHFYTRLKGPWPPHLPHKAQAPSLQNIFTLAPFTFVFGSEDQDELWKKVAPNHAFDVMISWGCNTVMSLANPKVTAETLKKIPFVVVFELFDTELASGFADIVLPDTCYLEESGWAEGYGFNFNHSFGMEDWCYHVQVQVVPPTAERRNVADVLREILNKIGRTPQVNYFYNYFCNFGEHNKLKPNEMFTQEEMCDRVLRHFFGDEHNWEWFKKNGFIRWPKKVEEAYWRYFIDARHVIYLEYMIDIGERVKELTQEADIQLNMEQYTPFVSWFPCSVHKQSDSSFDLYCFSYRDILHSGSHTMEQPWIDEASLMNPYTYNITMNEEVAKSKGIKDGDVIEIESTNGETVRGLVKLMQGQHPKTMGIAACAGHWGKGMPIAKGKGTNFDTLMSNDLRHVDPVSLNIETAVRVKVRKAAR